MGIRSGDCGFGLTVLVQGFLHHILGIIYSEYYNI